MVLVKMGTGEYRNLGQKDDALTMDVTDILKALKAMKSLPTN
jgi:hypothetical protein